MVVMWRRGRRGERRRKKISKLARTCSWPRGCRLGRKEREANEVVEIEAEEVVEIEAEEGVKMETIVEKIERRERATQYHSC